MELRNIHFEGGTGVPPVRHEAPSPTAAIGDRLRIRHVTASPAEEYQLRPGNVQPISGSLAALILSRKGKVEVSTKGIKVERVDLGGTRYYFHPDSRVCSDLSVREHKVVYVINRLAPEIIHLLDETGRYLESLPERGNPDVLDNDAQAIELANNKRVIKRAAEHLQRLHGKDTAEALQNMRDNSAEMLRVVQTLPAENPTPDVAPASSPLGDRIHQGSTKINDFRKQKQSAAAFGRALSTSRTQQPAELEAELSAEDWSSNSRFISTAQPPTEIESW